MAKAAVASVLAVLMLAFSGPGTKAGWWHFRIGMLLFAASAAVALVGLVLSLMSIRRSRRGALISALFSGIVLGVVGMALLGGRGKPPIHDISTDLQDPPEFVTVSPPQPGLDPEQQVRAYSDLKTLQVALPPPAAFQRAVAATQSLGWTLVTADQARGLIEANDTTSWFGFTDDVVVRILPSAMGSKVDVRSTSRVGKSDVGKNAERIREFLEEMEP